MTVHWTLELGADDFEAATRLSKKFKGHTEDDYTVRRALNLLGAVAGVMTRGGEMVLHGTHHRTGEVREDTIRVIARR